MSYLAITGGVGGAKLALGLAKTLGQRDVVFVVNTGDDFEHLGFHISPDVDTLTYTLADEANPETGWGRRDESWNFIAALDQLGGDTWFRLGDRDLALHTLRRQRLAEGASLTEVTAEICRALGIAHTILPMSDDAIRTQVHTQDGPLAFQHYFVRDRCEPAVTGFHFDGIDSAAVNPALIAMIGDIDGVIICPSNPFVSVDPILAVPGMRTALAATAAPIVAVSPIVAGTAIKGPTAKMMAELNVPATTEQVARHYQDLISGFVLDEQDAGAEAAVSAMGLETKVAQTVMTTLHDKVELAREVIAFTAELATRSAR